MNVRAILQRKGSQVATADCRLTLREVARRLKQERIGALPMVDGNGELVGIISERDIVNALADLGPEAAERPACDFMQRDVITCRPEDTTDRLMEIMTEHRVRHLPVVNGGHLVGIVSIGDVVKQRMEEIAFEAEQMKQYIVS